MSARTRHVLIGSATMVAFLATGTWMMTGMPDRFADDLLFRTLFRTNHVYILFAGLVHLAFGAMYPTRTDPRAIRWGKVSSVLLTVAPVLLVLAFIFEPPRGTMVRPLTSVGVLLAFAAVMTQLRATRVERLSTRKKGRLPIS